MDREPVFRERQQFRQLWLWGLLGGLAFLMVVLGPEAWAGVIILSAVGGLVYSLRLETEVRTDGIYVKMWPIHWSFRRIPWSEIERYESTRYRPLREFGGWGIRWVPGKLAYNVSGNRGVWIERMDGRTILIGSQRAEEFARAIDEAVQ